MQGPRSVKSSGAVYDKLRKEICHRRTPQFSWPHLVSQVLPLDSHSNQKQPPSQRVGKNISDRESSLGFSQNTRQKQTGLLLQH